jgi:uncharacterized protein (TIGR02145 family)
MMTMIYGVFGQLINSFVTEMKRHTMSRNYLILVGLLTLTMFSCEELEPINPADPAFTLDPPTLLSANALTDARMEITWKNNEEHTKEFVVQRKSGSGSYNTIATVAQNILTFTDTACVLEVEYNYVVQCKVESNVSANSNTLTKATTFPGPGNLNVITISDESVRITWIDNTGYESGFKIERDSGGGFVELGTVSSDVTEYTDTGLILGQNYSYRVAAYTSANTSSWTTVTAAIDFPTPTNLSAIAINDSGIELTWTDNCSFETGYQIERDAGSGFTEVGTVSADVTSYTDSGLSFGQSYDYRVAAFTLTNTGNWATVTAGTNFPTPTNLSAIAINDSEIELTWTDNCSFETGYQIERDAGSGFTEVGTVSADVTSYTDSGLIGGQSYSYRIAAYTTSNTSYYTTTTATTTIGLVDYDGNVYEIVQIGNQIWMAENLKVTHYRNGDPLQTAFPSNSGAYCIYNNNTSDEIDTYGALYNWYAVADSRNIAPEGWHVPTDDEWQELEVALGRSPSESDSAGYRGTNEGSKLAGNADLWDSGLLENDSEFGSSGFTALPGGYRHYPSGNYYYQGHMVYFLSATEEQSDRAWCFNLHYDDSRVYRQTHYKNHMFAVRLLRD